MNHDRKIFLPGNLSQKDVAQILIIFDNVISHSGDVAKTKT